MKKRDVDLSTCLHCGQYILSRDATIEMCDECADEGHEGTFYIACPRCRATHGLATEGLEACA